MKKTDLVLVGMMTIGILGGCSKRNAAVVAEEAPAGAVLAWGANGMSPNHKDGGADGRGYRIAQPVGMMPKPTAFRMSGDYADNVAVTLDAQGNLVYFPDPSDISEESKPIPLGDGWWLNRQGLSEKSVFTRYTFEEYSKLKNVPSIKELKASIIPGARVIQIRVLPEE